MQLGKELATGYVRDDAQETGAPEVPGAQTSPPRGQRADEAVPGSLRLAEHQLQREPAAAG